MEFLTLIDVDGALTHCVGQANLQFPTTCPSCDHSPLEADSCVPNKALRNTMRVWLEKRKKKEGAKVAAQAPTPPVDSTPAATEGLPAGDAPGKSVESNEDTVKAEDPSAEQVPAVTNEAVGAAETTASATAQPNEVGLGFVTSFPCMGTLLSRKQRSETEGRLACPRRMNTINATCACDCRVSC